MGGARDNNGDLVFVGGFPIAANKISPGVLTSVNNAAGSGITTTFGVDTYAVILTTDTKCWVRLGYTSSVAATIDGAQDHFLTPNVPQMFATKSAKYIAAIGGGGTLRYTELN